MKKIITLLFFIMSLRANAQFISESLYNHYLFYSPLQSIAGEHTLGYAFANNSGRLVEFGAGYNFFPYFRNYSELQQIDPAVNPFYSGPVVKFSITTFTKKNPRIYHRLDFTYKYLSLDGGTINQDNAYNAFHSATKNVFIAKFLFGMLKPANRSRTIFADLYFGVGGRIWYGNAMVYPVAYDKKGNFILLPDAPLEKVPFIRVFPSAHVGMRLGYAWNKR